MSKERSQVIKKKITGQVVSDKMDKTIVVLTKTLKAHPLYKKRYKVSRKYHAHDPQNAYKVGDTVTIVHSRPFSAKKRWRVLEESTDKKKSKK